MVQFERSSLFSSAVLGPECCVTPSRESLRHISGV